MKGKAKKGKKKGTSGDVRQNENRAAVDDEDAAVSAGVFIFEINDILISRTFNAGRSQASYKLLFFSNKHKLILVGWIFNVYYCIL